MLPTKTLVKIQQDALKNALTHKPGTYAGYDDDRDLMLLTNDSYIIYLIPEAQFILNIDQLDLSKDTAMRALSSSCDDLYPSDNLVDTERVFITPQKVLCHIFTRQGGEEVWIQERLLNSAGFDRMHTVNQPGGPGRPCYIVDDVQETVDAVCMPVAVPDLPEEAEDEG